MSNTDDHLRNHGFLRERTDGWSLSPAFDINPNPDPGAKRLSTTIDFGNDFADIDLLIDVADAFRLGPEDAIAILRDVLDAHRDWRTVASSSGLTSAEIDDMSRAFEHDRSERAIKIVGA